MTIDEQTPDGEPISDEVIAAVSDYLDGALTGERKAEVERKIASGGEWQRAHAELVETRDALSGLMKARAPASFDQEVTSTIHQRSAGRFFGRRTFGDRVPFGVLLVVALLVLIPIAYVMWSSSTGSLKRDRDADPAPPPPQGVIQKP